MCSANRCGGEILQREVAGRHGIERIAHRPGKSQSLGGGVAIDGKRRAGESGCSKRRLVQSPGGIGEPSAVAIEHFDIGKAVMTERDRLGRLHMGITRHDRGAVGLRLATEGALQRHQCLIGARTAVAQP